MNNIGLAADSALSVHQRRLQSANGLESAFLSEMLKSTGLRTTSDPFGTTGGESQFSSMLNDAYAEAIAGRIDLGLFPGGGISR